MIITQFLILKVGTSHFLLDLLAPPCNTQGLFLSLSLSQIFLDICLSGKIQKTQCHGEVNAESWIWQQWEVWRESVKLSFFPRYVAIVYKPFCPGGFPPPTQTPSFRAWVKSSYLVKTKTLLSFKGQIRGLFGFPPKWKAWKSGYVKEKLFSKLLNISRNNPWRPRASPQGRGEVPPGTKVRPRLCSPRMQEGRSSAGNAGNPPHGALGPGDGARKPLNFGDQPQGTQQGVSFRKTFLGKDTEGDFCNQTLTRQLVAPLKGDKGKESLRDWAFYLRSRASTIQNGQCELRQWIKFMQRN